VLNHNQYDQHPALVSNGKVDSRYAVKDKHASAPGPPRNIKRCTTFPPPITNQRKRKIENVVADEQLPGDQSRDSEAYQLSPSLECDAQGKKQRLIHNKQSIGAVTERYSSSQGQSWTRDYGTGARHQSVRHFGDSPRYDRPSMSWRTVSHDEDAVYHQVSNNHHMPPYAITSRIVSWEGGKPPPPHESSYESRLRAEFEAPHSPHLRRREVHERIIHARPAPGENTEHQRSVQSIIIKGDPSVMYDNVKCKDQEPLYDSYQGPDYDIGRRHHMMHHEMHERYDRFHEGEHARTSHIRYIKTHDHNDAFNDRIRRTNVPTTMRIYNDDHRAWSSASNERQQRQYVPARDYVEGKAPSESSRIVSSWGPPVSSRGKERGHYTSWAREMHEERLVQDPSFSELRDDVHLDRRISMVTHHSVRTNHGHHAPRMQNMIEASPSHTEQRDDISMEEDDMTPVRVSQDQLRTKSGILLLAQPQDRISLSETLSMIRENIEVFTATPADVDAPAPGRKRPVVVDQVGLRCIHCRDAIHQGERVKRAVCFPSSIKRIYRTVIDMKLDHFQSCKFVPVRLKNRLDELKANNTRSTGTTMHYFVQAAKRMGMADGPHGVKMAENQDAQEAEQKETKEGCFEDKIDADKIVSVSFSSSADTEGGGQPENSVLGTKDITRCRSDSFPINEINPVSSSTSMDVSTGDESEETNDLNDAEITSAGSNTSTAKTHITYTGKVLLAHDDDKTALSPLRCFLRENVYAFSATSEDIAVRTPTTFSVELGQVGIGCIHCHSLPAKERSNRAVCFPFSIGRIYQSVADIQRFHLGECKMVPDSVKAKFSSLQSASSKGSKGLATRQYWVASAKKLGLTDTPNGIRFNRDPAVPLAPAISLDILAQVASDVTTASRPLVLPEDKDTIAEFLFAVMEQLQPCRFTEADRNKRRLKDVGCIGVECKHCAGQVESRKFFWSSVNAVESNFVSVHTHMMECRMIPEETKNRLAELKKLRKEQTSSLKTGSQKAFFARVWQRLHDDGNVMPICQEISPIIHSDKPEILRVRSNLEDSSVVAV